MNTEDLNQIREIVREEIRAEMGTSEARLREEIGSVETRLLGEIGGVEARLREEIGGVETRLREEIQAAEARSQEFARDIETHLLKEMQRGFDRMDQRFERFEHRVERVEYENFGMSKSLTDAQRLDSATAATLSAQQRAIYDLYRQVAEIKRNLPPQNPPH